MMKERKTATNLITVLLPCQELYDPEINLVSTADNG